MKAVIRVENLTKTFNRGQIRAVDNLNLEVFQGEIFGFLGPNGAGKTTTIRILMDFISPTSGRASIFGMDCQKQGLKIKKDIGYLAGDVKLYEKYDGWYLTKFLANLNGGLYKKWVEELVQRLEIDMDRKIDDLSKGNKQKMGLLQALSQKPKLLILDEPTGGLDPLMQIEFYKIVKEMKKEGTTIFMSSHVLSEVEKICDRAAILKDGKLAAVKSVEELGKAKTRRVNLYFKDKYNLNDFKLDKIEIKHQSEKHLQLVIHGDINPLINVLNKYQLQDITFNEADLEEVFLKFYQREEKK
ncbi:MAG: ABC transporter ATP-binding protein [Patescibacteria group bacterium]|nr:ABC transporter ATP-binding protein [Patescibacteria group bacterium]